jgi:hypothetical protein
MDALPDQAAEVAADGEHAGQSPESTRRRRRKPPPPQCGWEIIRDYFAKKYGDGYRTGDAVYCNAERREVRRLEACAALPPDLIGPLQRATNAPRNKSQNGEVGDVNPEALPAFWKKWVPTAWAAFVDTMPDEDGAEPGRVRVAAEGFRRLIRDLLLSQVTLTDVIADAGGFRPPERRSLADWCKRFAKVGPWRSIRSFQCYCRLADLGDGEVRLEIAIRHGLLGQQQGSWRTLLNLNQNTFTRRCQRYEVGVGGKDYRVHGRQAVVLHQDLVEELTSSLLDDLPEPGEREYSHTRTEGCPRSERGQ